MILHLNGLKSTSIKDKNENITTTVYGGKKFDFNLKENSFESYQPDMGASFFLFVTTGQNLIVDCDTQKKSKLQNFNFQFHIFLICDVQGK